MYHLLHWPALTKSIYIDFVSSGDVIKKSCMRDRSVEEKLYELLKLGFDLLSEEDCRLKQCFHYFAAFPEDSTIIFEEIVFHWTAEKLVPANDGDDPTADAFSLLKKLWERSFIESNGQFGSDECYMLNFKVHDVRFGFLHTGTGLWYTPCKAALFLLNKSKFG
jgi:hypothetical protein